MSIITLLFSLLLVKVVGFFLKLLPSPDFASLNGFLNVSSHVANVFAWSQMFLPVKLIFAIFTLIAVCYTCKFMWKLVHLIITFFK